MSSIERKEHFNEVVFLMPLKDKVFHAEEKIKEFLAWCKENNHKEILISFSGGKDSTVLFDLVIKVHKQVKSDIYLIPAYAIEITFPSTIKFIKDVTNMYKRDCEYIKDPLFVRPKKAWVEILQTKGYPIFSKQISVMLNRLKRSKTKNLLTRIAFGIEESARYKLSYKRLFLLDSDMTTFENEEGKKVEYFFSEKCCDYVKGGLKHEKRPSFIGTMANESLFRKQSWIKNGCNIYNKEHPMSRPLSLWTSKDVWEYVRQYGLRINDAYGYDPIKHNIDALRFSRLGCTSCPLGSSIEEILANRYSKNNELAEEFKYQNRFEKLLQYSPNLYEAQVWRTGMYRIIADMNVKIRNDKKFMEYFEKRRKEIDKWYENIEINLIRVMVQIEQNPQNTTNWKYEISDFEKAFDHYRLNKPNNFEKKIQEIREKKRI